MDDDQRGSGDQPSSKQRWNTDAQYPGGAGAGEEGLLFDLINWLIRGWRRLRLRLSRSG